MKNREKKVEEKWQEIKAVEKRMEEIKKEMLATPIGGLGGLGVLLIIEAGTTSLPSILIWIGSALLISSFIGGIWISRH